MRFAFRVPAWVRALAGRAPRARFPCGPRIAMRGGALQRAAVFMEPGAESLNHGPEFPGHTRVPVRHTRVLLRHAWVLLKYTRVLLRHTPVFRKRTREFVRHARVFVKHTWVFVKHTGVSFGEKAVFPAKTAVLQWNATSGRISPCAYTAKRARRSRSAKHSTAPDMPWDTASWDDGHWDSDSISTPPKKTNKPMKRPRFFPVPLADQIVWLTNFKKLPGYTATLTLVAGDVTARMLDTDNAIYALDAYRGGMATFPNAAFERIQEALHGNEPGNIVWLTFAAPGGTPAAVAYGCLDRVFTYIEDKVLKSPGYTKAIGLDLGTEISATPAPSPITAPAFALRFGPGGKLEVVWTKGQYDGVRLQFDLGAAGTQNDVDMRPNYTLNWLPAAGQSAIIKVRLMYILKGEDTGTWSDWKQWTLTGA